MPKRKEIIVLLILASLLAPLVTAQPGHGQTIPNSGKVYLPFIARQATPTPTQTTVPTATPTNEPTSIPTLTPTNTPTLTPAPTPTIAMRFICASDAYNCSDFNTQAAAQEVFDYCVDLGFGDIHRLDFDNNGRACESLP